MMKRIVLSLLALLLVFSLRAHAQTTPAPELLNFQGRLAKPDGTPVADGTYTLRFSLWSAATGGTEKWFSVMNPVVVKNGGFAVFAWQRQPDHRRHREWRDLSGNQGGEPPPRLRRASKSPPSPTPSKPTPCRTARSRRAKSQTARSRRRSWARASERPSAAFRPATSFWATRQPPLPATPSLEKLLAIPVCGLLKRHCHWRGLGVQLPRQSTAKSMS